MRKFICLLLLLCCRQACPEALNIAVASNLTHTLTEISAAYYRDEGKKVNLTFGSSGNFARQIVQGAPYGIFISAGKRYVDFIRAKGAGINDSKALANGRISLYVPATSNLKQPAMLAEALKVLQYGDYRRMSIANPEHAPYGQAAREALINAGIWVINHEKLLLGENAAQAMQFCLSGSVDLCIVPTSFLALQQFAGKGYNFPLPENWHQPITQYAVLLAGHDERLLSYYDYLSSGASQAIFRKYGYGLASP